MKCPKCNYTSFDYLDTCKKCGKDLIEHKEKYNIRSLLFAGAGAGGAAMAVTAAEEGFEFDFMEDEEQAPAAAAKTPGPKPEPADDPFDIAESSDDFSFDSADSFSFDDDEL